MTTKPESAKPTDDADPFWLTEPCPSWCDRVHHDWDSTEDCHHHSEFVEHVELSTMPTNEFLGGSHGVTHVPHCLEPRTDQGYRETSPRVHIEEHRCRGGNLALTLDEAEQVAAALTRLIAQGRNHQAID